MTRRRSGELSKSSLSIEEAFKNLDLLLKNTHFIWKQTAFSIAESLKNLNFLLKNTHFVLKTGGWKYPPRTGAAPQRLRRLTGLLLRNDDFQLKHGRFPVEKCWIYNKKKAAQGEVQTPRRGGGASLFSIENAEIMENCSWKMMIFDSKMPDYFAWWGGGASLFRQPPGDGEVWVW